MNNSIRQLKEAEEYFYSWRLVEAYHIFRRYFDRIPFKVEENHSKYIGMFVRILLELGKQNELDFYAGELEKCYEKNKSPDVSYILASIYMKLTEPRLEAARKILEGIILQPEAKDFKAKAKMMLAAYYDHKRNSAVCRKLIFSIETEDPYLLTLVDIWKAKVFKDESKFDEAEKMLASVLVRVSPETEWYGYYCAKIIEASLYLSKGELEKTRGIVAEVRALFDCRQFKSLRGQLDDLEMRIREKSEVGTLKIEYVEKVATRCSYENRTVEFKKESPAEKLLTLFMKKGFINKSKIMIALYDRDYAGSDDDRLIYYHIHALRKRLRNIGLPEGAITNEGKGYRLTPKIELISNEATL